MRACFLFFHKGALPVLRYFIDNFPVDILAVGDFEHQVRRTPVLAFFLNSYVGAVISWTTTRKKPRYREHGAFHIHDLGTLEK